MANPTDAQKRIASLIAHDEQRVPGIAELGTMTLARGVVFKTPGNGDVRIFLDGATTSIIAEYIGSDSPAINDVVECLVIDDRVVVIGVVGKGGGGGPFQITRSYAVMGNIFLTGPLPPIFVPSPGTQVVTLVGVRCATQVGSVDFDVQHNGAGVASLTGLTATTSPNTTDASGTVTIADGESIGVNVISASSAQGLSVSLILEITS